MVDVAGTAFAPSLIGPPAGLAGAAAGLAGVPPKIAPAPLLTPNVPLRVCIASPVWLLSAPGPAGLVEVICTVFRVRIGRVVAMDAFGRAIAWRCGRAVRVVGAKERLEKDE
jgi:hypothetical protein